MAQIYVLAFILFACLEPASAVAAFPENASAWSVIPESLSSTPSPIISRTKIDRPRQQLSATSDDKPSSEYSFFDEAGSDGAARKKRIRRTAVSTHGIDIANAMRRSPRRVARFVWDGLPEPVMRTEFMRQFGRYIYRHFTRNTSRVQTHYTLFMRNPPLLKTLADLTATRQFTPPLKVVSIGCSTGAELYSLLYTLRKACPDLAIAGTGVDLSEAVVETARNGLYRADRSSSTNPLFFSGRPEVFSHEVQHLSDILEPTPDGDLRVRDWIKDGTRWLAGDATDPKLIAAIGQQDIVLANNVIGPMDDRSAKACLHNVMNMVVHGGLLVVDGIDLDVKVQVIRGSGFQPVSANIEAIWNADTSKEGWPWMRWGREPFDSRHAESEWRYAIVFRRIS